jgi:hypothetical protein
MKVENKKKTKKTTYSWLSTGTYHENLAIMILFSSKSGEFGSIYFSFWSAKLGPYIFVFFVF